MDRELTVREADRELLDAILAIENASFTCPWSEKSFLDAFDAETVTIYAAEEDGQLVGFSCLLVVEDEAEVLNIASAPEFRRRGAGQALLSRMLSDCEARGVSAVYLEVRESNAPARGLYQKSGFCEIGVRRNYYDRPKENAVLMKYTINKDSL